MFRALLLINLGALAIGGYMMLHVLFFAAGGGSARVDDMMRGPEPLIERDRLEEYAQENFPAEVASRISENPGKWLQELSQKAALRSTSIIILAAVSNLVVIFLLKRCPALINGQQAGDGDA